MLLMVGVQTLAAVLAPAAKASQTLSAIKKRGHVACGVAEGAVGFSEVGRSGKWSGLDIEFCRAVAAGVLGDPDKVAFVPLVTAKRIQAVRSGEVDLLASSSGWTLSRDAGEGVRFVAALYHESQALLVRRKQNITSALELSGSTVCVLEGSPDADNVDSYFRGKGMTYKVMAQATWSELVRSFALGQCTALTSDRTRLAFERARLVAGSVAALAP